MATVPVDVAILVKGQNKLDKLQRQTGQLEKEFAALQGRAPKAANGIRKFGDDSQRASKKVDGLRSSVGNLIKGFAAISAAKFIFFKTAELETQTRSLKVLTGELETAKEIVKELQDFARVTPFTSSELIATAKRLKAFGVDTEKLVDITKRLGDVSGATGAELNGIATAYGQIQAKGRLQGEELLQLQERGIGIQKQLQKQLGLTDEQFRKALEGGKISAQEVEKALISLTNTGGQYAKGAISQSDTLNGKMSTLQDGIDNLARRIGQVLEPAIKRVLNLAIRAVNAINDLLAGGFATDQSLKRIGLATPGNTTGDLQGLIDSTKGVTGAGLTESGLKQVADQIKRNQQLAADTAARINATRPLGVSDAEKALFEQLQGESQAALQRLARAQKLLQENKKKLDQVVTAPTGGSGSSDAAAKKAAEKLAAATSKRLRDSSQLLQVLDAQLKIEKEQNPIKKLLLESDLDKLEINQKYDNLLAGETNELIRQNLERARALELESAMLTERQKQEKLGTKLGKDMAKMFLDQGKVKEELTETEELTRDIARTVASDLSRGIQGLIQGTTTLNDIASQLLNKLGGMFLDAAFSGMFKGMKIKGFADGGRPPMGQPSVVGERGPELFVPDQPGRVIPSDAFSAARAALAGGDDSAGGGADAAFAENSAALGVSQSYAERHAAAQQMANTPVAVDVSYSAVRIDNLDYIDSAQFLEGLAAAAQQGARQGRAQVFADMRNKPSTRASLGMR